MTELLSSPARLKLYTSVGLYGETLKSLLFGQQHHGGDVAMLEDELQRRLGAKHVIATPLARVGIHLAIKHTIQSGQGVIMSPYTIADVVNMVICAGGIPVFADIDRGSCNISADAIADRIDSRTGAVLVTHFYGQVADMDAIRSVCDARKIPVLEDAAQAFGGRFNGKPAGTLSHAGVYSFGMYKNINAFYGGAVVTDDDSLANRIRTEISDWPMQSTSGLRSKVLSALITDVVTSDLLFRTVVFRFFRWAFLNNIEFINNKLKIDVDPKIKRLLPDNYRCTMTPLQARLVMSQLDKLEKHMDMRLCAASLYYEGLKDIPELIIAPFRDDRSHIYWYFPIQYQDRKALVSAVLTKGRDITMSYHRNCAELQCFKEFARDCPNAHATANSVIYLPTYPRYGEREVTKTIAAIRSHFGR